MKELKKAIKNLKKVVIASEKNKEISDMNLFGEIKLKEIDVKKINKIIKKLEEMI